MEYVGTGFRLLAINRTGLPSEAIADLQPHMREICEANLGLYDQLGFHPPWTAYLAIAQGSAVGFGAFVGPPENNRVEIAYYTSPNAENRGYATRTAGCLISIARASDPTIEISAKTAPEVNASTAILARLDFELIGTVTDHEIGEAWMWLLR